LILIFVTMNNQWRNTHAPIRPSDNKKNIGVYNTQTGETKILDGIGSEDSYFDIYNANEIFTIHNRDHANNIYQMAIIDSNCNALDFDLSEYSVQTIWDATEDYILFTAVNPNGNYYTLITYFKGDYAILSPKHIINCKTGEVKTYADDKISIEAFDKDSGMLLMKSDGAYYLADPSDPNTLLNPFELAQN